MSTEGLRRTFADHRFLVRPRSGAIRRELLRVVARRSELRVPGRRV